MIIFFKSSDFSSKIFSILWQYLSIFGYESEPSLLRIFVSSLSLFIKMKISTAILNAGKAKKQINQPNFIAAHVIQPNTITDHVI